MYGNNGYIRVNNWLILFGAVLCIPLHNFAGYVLLPLFLWIIYSTKSRVCKTDMLLILLLLIISIVQFCLTYNGNIGAWIRLFVSVLGFYAMYLQYGASKEYSHRLKWRKNNYDILYWITFSICTEELLRYCIYVIQNGWYYRNLHKYLADMHVVDFSVILIFCFGLGIKTKHYKSTFALTVFNLLFYPARTYKLFVIIFIGSYILYDLIRIFQKSVLFDSYFKIILWLLLAIYIFAAIWVYHLSFIFEIKAKYESLFDVSNQERFETIIYGFKVLFSGNFLFKGMQVLDMEAYVKMADYQNFHGAVQTIPHNTFLLMMVRYSIILSVLYLIVFTRLADKFTSRANTSIIFAYLLVCCILHDLLMDERLLMLLSVLFIPEFKRGISIRCVQLKLLGD